MTRHLSTRPDWWIEIITTQPWCTYYFGPFANVQEARLYLPGYVEDIEQEGCASLWIQFKQCQPQHLTIFEEDNPAGFENASLTLSPVISMPSTSAAKITQLLQ